MTRFFLAWLCFVAPLFAADQMVLPPITTNLASIKMPAGELKQSEILSRVACSLCHVFPEPSLLDKKTWNENVLPKMKMYLGIELLDVEKTPEGKLYKASGLFPDAPRVPKENWPKIAAFYLTQAPDQLPTVTKPEIEISLPNFVVDRARFRRNPPLTTAVTIHPEENVIFSGDANQQAIDVLAMDGSLLASVPVGNIPTTIKKVGDTFYVGAIGHFFPVEDPRGQILSLRLSTNGSIERNVHFSSLPRLSHLNPVDLNGDGKIDLVASMFGYLSGRFSWFEATGTNQFTEHVLTNKAGAVKSAAYDFDKDGDLDIAVLFGQEIESLWIYSNLGKSQFSSPQEVFRRPASYGHSAFDLADFNGDGQMDFLVANGDNGDYESPPKPYHGLRIYLASGGGKYTEKWFYPMNGAFGTLARDFDEDGDLDIATVSFFPDYEKNPRDSFVYLENLGNFEFKARTFPECIGGRWIALDAGDLDGDGDLDLALASLIQMPTAVPDFVKKTWEKSSPSVLVLKNQLRSGEAKATK